MDYRLDYISSYFRKIGKKKLETYVITRLWHRLNDDEVKFVPQQYVKRNIENYALTDLYLPQIGIHIEVNEPAHYLSTEREYLDKLRQDEIKEKTGHEILIIDCRANLRELNSSIDQCVDAILTKVSESRRKKTFKPWHEDELSPMYHTTVGKLRTADEPCLRTTEDICTLFNTIVPKRGFLRPGGVNHPQDPDLMIWWPSKGNEHFTNEISDNGEEITEYSNRETNRANHVQNVLNEHKRRITFFKEVDILGFKFYKFKGIYELQRERTMQENQAVWKRVATQIRL